jgi:anti-sigma factor RsiW
MVYWIPSLRWKVIVAENEPIHPSEEVIEFYSMGEIKGPDLQAFEEHLFICSECRQRVTRMDFFLSMLRAASSNPVPANAGTEGPGLAEFRSERRRELRDTCSRLLSIRVLETTAATESTVALLVNKSSSGAGILAATQVSAGSDVLVRMPSSRNVGLVLYSVKQGSMWRMGITFQPNPAVAG